MRTIGLAPLAVFLAITCSAVSTSGQSREKPTLPAQAIFRLTTGLDSSGNATHIHPVPFSRDGSTIAWGDRKDHTVRIWNVKKGAQAWKLHGHESSVLCTAYSPDGDALASGSYDGSVRIWDLLTGRTTKVLRPEGRRSPVYTVAFSPDGKTVASGEWGGAIRLWDVASGKLLHTVQSADPRAAKSSPAFIQVVAFSPDGKTLVSGSEGGVVQFWDAATMTEREKLRKVVPAAAGGNFARPYASSLDFSPDGKVLAVAFYGTGQAIFLWDTQTGEEVQKLDGTASAYTIDFSPDGKFLLSAARELRVWELASGKTVLQIPEPREWIYAIYSGSFSPDGSLLTSGGQDNAVIVWDAFGFERGWEPPEASAATLAQLGKQLGDVDPALAYRAIGTLSKMGKPAVALLKNRLQAIPNADPKQIHQWIRELDDIAFTTREKAEAALRDVGEAAEQGLRDALRTTASAEVRLRARRLLQAVVPLTLTRGRAVIVLEYVGSTEARQVLATLAKGDERAALTRDARASLTRLSRRPAKDQ